MKFFVTLPFKALVFTEVCFSDEFELGGAGGGARNRLGGQNCWCRDHCSSQTAPTHAQQQSHDPSPPMPCCSRGGTAASWSICSSFDLLSDELDNDQMSECGGGGQSLSYNSFGFFSNFLVFLVGLSSLVFLRLLQCVVIFSKCH